MNKLSKYLADNGIMHNFFARKIGVSVTTLCHIMKNVRTPKVTLAIRIEEETGGRVSVYDWDNRSKISNTGKDDQRDNCHAKKKEQNQTDKPKI